MEPHSKYIVLNYHRVDDGIPGAERDEFVVSLQQFRKQLEYLISEKVPLVTGNVQKSGTQTGVMLSFDDGFSSDFTIVRSLLLEFGMTATFFPVVNLIGRKGRATADQIRTLVQDGFSIGSHGMNHRNCTLLSLHDQKQELEESRIRLEQLTGKTVTSFAFPYGAYNDALVQMALEAGYQQVMTTRLLLNDNAAHPKIIHRWNIKRSTAMKEFVCNISANGQLPWRTEAKSAIRNFTRTLIGTSGAGRIQNFIEPGNHD